MRSLKNTCQIESQSAQNSCQPLNSIETEKHTFLIHIAMFNISLPVLSHLSLPHARPPARLPFISTYCCKIELFTRLSNTCSAAFHRCRRLYFIDIAKTKEWELFNDVAKKERRRRELHCVCMHVHVLRHMLKYQTIENDYSGALVK